MDNRFFEQPILNSPYEYPKRHWELDDQGQPTQRIIEERRRAKFITPIPKPRKRKDSAAAQQVTMLFDEGKGLSTEAQRYDPTSIINRLRPHVDRWRGLPNPNHWQVTPETARLLQHSGRLHVIVLAIGIEVCEGTLVNCIQAKEGTVWKRLWPLRSSSIFRPFPIQGSC